MLSITARFFALLVPFTLLLSDPGFADGRRLLEDFHQLKQTDENYEPVGAVCEQVARLRLAEQYPSRQYTVMTGIAYFVGDRTVGELDVIVFRKSDGEAMIVGEVKCWKSLSGGLRKAHSQLKRFRDTMAGRNTVRFKNLSTGETYSPKQFDEVGKFITIAQEGSESAGYTMELDHSLEEFASLRAALLRCQKGGSCSPPAIRD